MDRDYLWDVPQFMYQPVRPPRDGVVGEQVFAAAWEQLMGAATDINEPVNGPFAAVLSSYPYRLTQRTASVISSVVCWFGTNMGTAFLEEAARLNTQMSIEPGVYVMLWAKRNFRISWINSGQRTLEACLTPDNPSSTITRASSKDYEAVEHLMYWLGTPAGQKFLASCELTLKKARHAEQFKAHLELNLGLSPSQVTHVLKMAAEYQPATS